MKLLLISDGNLEYDGRLRRLISVFNQVGELYTFTRGHTLLTEHGKICNASYISFIIGAINYARGMDNIDVLILDNRRATIPGFLMDILKHPDIIIQDCRELYLFSEVKHFSGKLGCVFEKLMAQKADIVICASQKRAEFLKNKFGLKTDPLIFENIRQLDYVSDEDEVKAQEKYGPLLSGNEYKIISLSGCNLSRNTDVLIKSLKNVRSKCKLFLAGSNNPEEEKAIRDLAAFDRRNEIIILGQLNHSELKYLVSRCHIGIVNYGQYDTNNKYCASGKLYEYIHEGIPVVTTTNPPLKQICDEERIGVADDRFAEGINEVLNNYGFYKERVKTYSKRVSVADNDSKLVREVKRLLAR